MRTNLCKYWFKSHHPPEKFHWLFFAFLHTPNLILIFKEHTKRSHKLCKLWQDRNQLIANYEACNFRNILGVVCVQWQNNVVICYHTCWGFFISGKTNVYDDLMFAAHTNVHEWIKERKRSHNMPCHAMLSRWYLKGC